MKLKFKAKGVCPTEYIINSSTINGIDLSLFPEGGKFIGDENTANAGIYNAEYIDGELVVTLAQKGNAYECSPTNGSHDWVESEGLVDATDFSNDTCYIIATSKPEGADYKRTANGWTVALLEEIEDELV